MPLLKVASFCRGGCKMRKVGDKIKIKSLKELLKIAERKDPDTTCIWLKTKNIQAGCNTPFNVEGMAKFCNKSIEIVDIVDYDGYKAYIIKNDRGWIFVEWMIKETRLGLELE